MKTTSSPGDGEKDNGGRKKKQKRVVQVVECPSDFPSSFPTPSSSPYNSNGGGERAGLGGRKRGRGGGTDDGGGIGRKNGEEERGADFASKKKKSSPGRGPPILDFHKAAQEIRELGSTTFRGKLKSQHKAEKYRAITGRDPKGVKIGVKHLWGMERRHREREEESARLARETGLVVPNHGPVAKRKKREEVSRKKFAANRKQERLYGPEPSVGFMKKGVLRVHKK